MEYENSRNGREYTKSNSMNICNELLKCTLEDLRSIIVVKAFAWWENKRPLDFTALDHAKNPTINCCTESEEYLAQAVGCMYKYLLQTTIKIGDE